MLSACKMNDWYKVMLRWKCFCFKSKEWMRGWNKYFVFINWTNITWNSVLCVKEWHQTKENKKNSWFSGHTYNNEMAFSRFQECYFGIYIQIWCHIVMSQCFSYVCLRDSVCVRWITTRPRTTQTLFPFRLQRDTYA